MPTAADLCLLPTYAHRYVCHQRLTRSLGSCWVLGHKTTRQPTICPSSPWTANERFWVLGSPPLQPIPATRARHWRCPKLSLDCITIIPAPSLNSRPGLLVRPCQASGADRESRSEERTKEKRRCPKGFLRPTCAVAREGCIEEVNQIADPRQTTDAARSYMREGGGRSVRFEPILSLYVPVVPGQTFNIQNALGGK